MLNKAYFYEPAAGGDGYGKDNKERAAFTALGYNFLGCAIGWQEARRSSGELNEDLPPDWHGVVASTP